MVEVQMNKVIGSPDEKEMELINKMTKREFGTNEIYVFSIVLCDNEIDRNFERFTERSLEMLAKLFLGKTGISDHDAKSEKQIARIFECKVESDERLKNSLGKSYQTLEAKAYVPRTKSNEDFITAIDSGIKKEISIRCAIAKKTCSICGKLENSCVHIKGMKYRGSLCYFNLENPMDAYEWSFVAIPAQISAGVTKKYTPKGGDHEKEEVIMPQLFFQESEKQNFDEFRI